MADIIAPGSLPNTMIGFDSNFNQIQIDLLKFKLH